MKTIIGFVGLGVMGANMCRRILESGHFDLVVYDVDQTKVDEIVALGARAAGSLEQLARATSLIGASLPNPAAVRSVFLDAGGVLDAAAAGTTILDFSTVDSETSKAVAAKGQERGIRYVDTPVSGGKFDSLAGTLTIIAGATEDELAVARPLLEVMGRSLHFAGQRGAGSTIKLVNNVISMGITLLTAEAFVLGAKAGVDAGTLFDVLQHCGGRSLRMTKRFPSILKGDFSPRFTVDLAEKDLRLAMTLAHSLRMPVPFASLTHDGYLAASASGRGGLDATAVIQLMEELNGIEVRGEPHPADVQG